MSRDRSPPRLWHLPPQSGATSRSDRATVLKINSVGAVGALSVIPAQAGIHASAQRCDEFPSARRPTRAPSAPRVIRRRRTLGAPLTPTDRLDSCLRRNDGTSTSRASANIQGGCSGDSLTWLYLHKRGPLCHSVTSPPAERGEMSSRAPLVDHPGDDQLVKLLLAEPRDFAQRILVCSPSVGARWRIRSSSCMKRIASRSMPMSRLGSLGWRMIW